MSDADEGNADEEANLHLDAERKLMHSVLSLFDDGAAATGQEALKHPEEVREAPFLQLVVAPARELLSSCTEGSSLSSLHIGNGLKGR